MSYSEKQYLQSLTKKQQLNIMRTDFFSDKELKVIKEEDAYVLPAIDGNEKTAWFIGGVLNNKKEYIKESGQYAFGERNRVYGKYEFDKADVKYIDEKVIYFNFYLSQWGHYLLDVIGRLWYIVKHPEYKIVYITSIHCSNNIKNNFLQLLKLLGISEDKLVFVNEITQFKEVIVPETSILVAKYWTKEYKQIIDLLVNNALNGCTLKKDRRIYCSRRHFAGSKESGEDSIEKVFRSNNYEIVYMEELNLIDQIRLLNDCKEVVCISGTLVHNAMFIRNKNCNFVVLNKTYKINPNIYLSNQISDANFTFVDVYLAPLPISIGKGPFIVTITKEFIDYCKDNKLNIDGIKTNIDKSIIFNYYISYIKKYRSKIFRGKEISSSGFEQYDVSYKQVREHYKEQLKLLNS